MLKSLQYIALVTITCLLFAVSLGIGKANISTWEVASVFFGNNKDIVLNNLVLNFRLPRSIVAVLVGIALPLAGMLLQELFRNPLAGPSVLGITSSAGLGVALVIFGVGLTGYASWQNNQWLLVIAGFLGAILALAVILIFAVRVQSLAAIVIIGFMLAGFSSALIGLLEYFSDSDQIKTYLFWGFGSLTGLTWDQILIFALMVLVGLTLSLLSLKGLNALQLGDAYAETLGVKLNTIKINSIVASALLTAVTTAFVGPISFIGLAVPHIARNLFKKNQPSELWLPNMFIGMNVMLVFMMISESFPNGGLPINLISALFGAPIVVAVLFQYQNRK